MCGSGCCISTKVMHSSLLTWNDFCLKQLKDRSQNAQKIRSGKISSHIFETCKNSVQPHGFNIYNNAKEMAMVIMCPCTYKNNELLRWKCVLRCCDKCQSIVLLSQDIIKDTTNTCPTIILHVYSDV